MSGSIEVIQHGVGTLLRKKAIFAVQVSKDHLFTAGAPVDGVAGKVIMLCQIVFIGVVNIAICSCMLLEKSNVFYSPKFPPWCL